MPYLDEQIFKQIGSRIKEIRIRKKMSQAELAEKSHISLPHISVIERGVAKMSLASFYRIIEALDVSADEILRPDSKAGNAVYRSELTEILSDCSSSECETILRIAQEVKGSMRASRSKSEEY